MNNKIVVWDPKGDYWEGSLVDDATARIVQTRGGAVLPTTPEHFKRSGCGGFFKRAWGAGWPLDYAAPKLCCPMVLFVDSQHRRLHWAFRLTPDLRNIEKARAGEPFAEGQLIVTGDTGQGYAHATTVTRDGPALNSRDLGKCDAHDGWTVMGTGLVHPSMDGNYGFGMYGAMPGVRVVWAALSLTQ